MEDVRDFVASVVLFAGIVGLPILFLVFVVIRPSRKANREAREEFKRATDNYRQGLAQLKQDPTNANLYERTLEAGRIYSNLTRQNRGVTLFDELALSNDLNAATAGAVQRAQNISQNPLSVTDRIGQLTVLKSQGLISDQEFSSSRAKILQSL